ncbi:transposase [Caldimonas tepidiphila]|uniref:transposase n=1 Tax=Caldimonas tepidiphila TaxID=2315841 RepID=UPI000E5B8430
MQPLLPAPAQQGRPWQVDLRKIINALRYLVRSNCGWQMLPHDFGLRQTVCWWFRKLMRRMLFATLHGVVLMLDREARRPGVTERRRDRKPERDGGMDRPLS